MKVLFLDFDGVLGPVMFVPDVRITGRDDAAMHIGCQDQIRRVVDATGCKVVISSNWRLSDTVDQMRVWLRRAEVIPMWETVVGMTPEPVRTSRFYSGKPRGDEITAWLAEHPEVTSFAIVDDIVDACMVSDADSGDWFRDHLLEPCFVQTMCNHGCTRADADALIALLGPA